MKTSPASRTVPLETLLLDHLLHATQPVPLELLAEHLSIDQQQVLVTLNRLRQAGCTIEDHPQRGSYLIESGLGTWLDYLQWACDLPDRSKKREVRVYQRTTSTQDATRELVERRGLAANGDIVIVDEQTAGRGRLGRQWIAPSGTSILFTRASVWPTTTATETIDHLTFAASVAVAEAIEAVAGTSSLDVKIKWPNDLLVDDRKIAGILVESFTCPDKQAHSAALIGIGINNTLQPEQLPVELRNDATSMSMCGQRVDRLRLLSETVRRLDHALMCEDVDRLVASWRGRCEILSQQINLSSDGKVIHGQVIDLDPYEGLIVRSNNGAILHLPAGRTTIL